MYMKRSLFMILKKLKLVQTIQCTNEENKMYKNMKKNQIPDNILPRFFNEETYSKVMDSKFDDTILSLLLKSKCVLYLKYILFVLVIMAIILFSILLTLITII